MRKFKVAGRYHNHTLEDLLNVKCENETKSIISFVRQEFLFLSLIPRLNVCVVTCLKQFDRNRNPCTPQNDIVQ